MSAAYFHVNIRGISICSTIYSQLTLLRPSALVLKEKEAKKDLASPDDVSVQELTSYVHASADNRKQKRQFPCNLTATERETIIY